jgi:hypothetical protein
MKFVSPVTRKEIIRRKKDGSVSTSHSYIDGNGARMPGVTTILGDGLPKAALINWAANATAEAAINRWDEFADMPPAKRLQALKDARWETTDNARRRGTEVHTYAEALVQGQEVTGVPDLLRGHVEGYARFLDAFDVAPVLVEVVVVNYSYGYAGTLDLVADIECPLCGKVCRWLLDVKTNEKGIYPETALQLAAYRYSEFYVDNSGEEKPMVEVAHCGAIHVTSDEAVLVPTTSEPAQFSMFRIAAKVRQWDQTNRELIGAPISVPATANATTARISWEDK